MLTRPRSSGAVVVIRGDVCELRSHCYNALRTALRTGQNELHCNILYYTISKFFPGVIPPKSCRWRGRAPVLDPDINFRLARQRSHCSCVSRNNPKSHKYVCIETYQLDTKSNPNPNPNPNFTIKQHAVVNILLNIVACSTYPEKFTRNMLFQRPCDLLSLCQQPIGPRMKMPGGGGGANVWILLLTALVLQ